MKIQETLQFQGPFLKSAIAPVDSIPVGIAIMNLSHSLFTYLYCKYLCLNCFQTHAIIFGSLFLGDAHITTSLN